MRIELLNEAGQVVLAYLVHRAWVAEYTALFEPMPEPSRSIDHAGA